MDTYCTLHEFYSKIDRTCVHCEPFCRVYPVACSRTPECLAYITDYEAAHRVPGWAVALIVILILLVIAIAFIVIVRVCPSHFLCKIGCMFSFMKKRKSRAGRDETDNMKLPYQTKNTWTSQDPVAPTIGYDINAIRRRTVMDRFWASIEQYPPQIGVDELEPLNTGDDPRKLKGDRASDDSNSENGTSGSDLNTAMTMHQTNQAMNPNPAKAFRPSLDNRAIIESYHLDRVTRQGSFRINNHVENGPQRPLPAVPSQARPLPALPSQDRLSVSRPEIHRPELHRPVQKGRRTGLKNLLNPRVRAGASETTV